MAEVNSTTSGEASGTAVAWQRDMLAPFLAKCAKFADVADAVHKEAEVVRTGVPDDPDQLILEFEGENNGKDF